MVDFVKSLTLGILIIIAAAVLIVVAAAALATIFSQDPEKLEKK